MQGDETVRRSLHTTRHQSLAAVRACPLPVIPAKAGIHFDLALEVRFALQAYSTSRIKMDSGFRRNDGQMDYGFPGMTDRWITAFPE